MTPNEVLELIAKAEGPTLEFKRTFTDQTLRKIVAFANSQGGTIILGVTDRAPHAVTGLSEDLQQLEERIMNLCRDRCRPSLEPPPVVEKVMVDDKWVLVIRVAESQQKPHMVNGKPYVRVGSTVREATRTELRRMFQESG
jgi:ATP-dependent DNA helicase RecG